jgi:8-oxo-dGTP pyrophosphatase MutT (NUDIX family)
VILIAGEFFMTIENIVRAVIINSEKNEILLARQKDRDYTFLPGGHIEFGESAKHALDREMVEEIGTEGKVGPLLWTIENVFTDREGKICHEEALYFIYAYYKRFYDFKIDSLEEHLEFLWVNLDDLEFFNLKPALLPDLIRKFNAGEETESFYSET